MEVDLVRQIRLKLQHVAIEFLVKTRLTNDTDWNQRASQNSSSCPVRRKIREVTVCIRTATVNAEVFL